MPDDQIQGLLDKYKDSPFFNIIKTSYNKSDDIIRLNWQENILRCGYTESDAAAFELGYLHDVVKLPQLLM